MRPNALARPLPALGLAALALAVSEPAAAFRCGSRLVTEGDPASKVLRFCGEPESVQERVIYRKGLTRPRSVLRGPGGVILQDEVVFYDESVVEVVVEEWTYNRGPHKLMRLVRFENGVVVEVLTLGYGYGG